MPLLELHLGNGTCLICGKILHAGKLLSQNGPQNACLFFSSSAPAGQYLNVTPAANFVASQTSFLPLQKTLPTANFANGLGGFLDLLNMHFVVL